MSLDVVIPLCNMFPRSTAQRLDTLNFALRLFYAKQTGIKIRIILVEQTLTGHYYFLPKIKPVPELEIVKVKINYPIFNKGWCTNIGVQHVKSPFFLLSESDMFCYDDYLFKAIKWMNETKTKWCFAWNDLYYTTKAEKVNVLNGQKLIRFGTGRRTSPRRSSAEGGLVLFDTQFFKNMGWANEWIQELGGPDNDLAERARFETGYYRAFPQLVFHLWHERLNTRARPTRTNNIRIIRMTRRTPSIIQKLLKNTKQGDSTEPCAALGPFLHAVNGYLRTK